MANLIRFHGGRGAERDVFFSRSELAAIVTAYSSGVIKGHWRDYAIDRSDDTALFSIFRSSREHPVYVFVKTHKPDQNQPTFALFNGPRRLASSTSLNRVMDRFRSLPRLVRSQ